ncbi:hypothetical protein OAU50_03355 [Planctomycetota bacterium]|nr:hypothetical protein [Planctomycetota bacterium]
MTNEREQSSLEQHKLPAQSEWPRAPKDPKYAGLRLAVFVILLLVLAFVYAYVRHWGREQTRERKHHQLQNELLDEWVNSPREGGNNSPG